MTLRPCIDPERIIPISRSTTEVFRTGTWSRHRPLHREKLSPCRPACPAGNNIHKALHHASRKDFDGALSAFLEENPLPGICGNVCHHPCETACNRAPWDGAVNIRGLERAASELGSALPGRLSEEGRDHPVAVVGSGPAGLSAAYHLARMGHPVTLIEAGTEIGGLLRGCIPLFRLPQEVLERDLERILSLGIRVQRGASAAGPAIEELRRTHHAVFLATGCGQGRSIAIPGIDLQGVYSGLEFLKQARGISHALKIQGLDDVPVLAFAGDGGTFDIGLQSLSGAADRNDDFIYVCMDNEAYMNTGVQVSSATPSFAWTGTSPKGKRGRKKQIMEIIAAHRVPYAATASIAFPDDLMGKLRRAKGIRGTRFIHLLSPCPTGWKMGEHLGPKVALAGVETNIFPLYEIVDGLNYTINHVSRCLPVETYLDLQGRFGHLGKEEKAAIQAEADRGWADLKEKALRPGR